MKPERTLERRRELCTKIYPQCDDCVLSDDRDEDCICLDCTQVNCSMCKAGSNFNEHPDGKGWLRKAIES